MVDRLPHPLAVLGQYLSGEFENRQQSLQDPTWYVHLRLWHRPVALFQQDSLTFFIEQVSVAAQTPPYRQRLLRLQSQNGQILGQYYGLREPWKFQGGGLQPEKLVNLSPDDLVDLPTCQVSIVAAANPTGGYHFNATMAPESLCRFEYDQTFGYVRLGFEIGPVSQQQDATLEFLMHDKGVDPESGKSLWGALMGPFQLVKQQAYPLLSL